MQRGERAFDRHVIRSSALAFDPEISMKTTLASLAAATIVAMPALAQDFPKTSLKVVGSISSLAPYKDFEVPFWTKTLSEKSKGAITAEIKGFNEMGLKGPEVLRLMSTGALEIGATVLAYLASDDPTIRRSRPLISPVCSRMSRPRVRPPMRRKRCTRS